MISPTLQYSAYWRVSNLDPKQIVARIRLWKVRDFHVCEIDKACRGLRQVLRYPIEHRLHPGASAADRLPLYRKVITRKSFDLANISITINHRQECFELLQDAFDLTPEPA